METTHWHGKIKGSPCSSSGELNSSPTWQRPILVLISSEIGNLTFRCLLWGKNTPWPRTFFSAFLCSLESLTFERYPIVPYGPQGSTEYIEPIWTHGHTPNWSFNRCSVCLIQIYQELRIGNRKTTPYLVANKKVAALETAGLNTGVVDNKNYITSRFMARIAN